jgi:glutamate dehydrogenase
MLTKLDDAKADLLTKASDLAGHGEIPDLPTFLDLYYRYVAPEDLIERTPADILGAALSHRRLAQQRPAGTVRVRVFTPTDDEFGWSSGHTVVESVTDDMPFLVDSVTSALAREGLTIHAVIHPQLRVRRTLAGELTEVMLDDSGDADESIVESWMHVEIDRVSDPDTQHRLVQLLESTLGDVREAVEDWSKMREVAMRVADELAQTPPPLPDAEVAEAWELLRWLVDDHFTFLGYREYHLEGDIGQERLVARPGTGLGILRFDSNGSESFQILPPEVRALAREARLLVLTKANSRSTVHRSGYLDYVGVKKIDAQGNVVGERRFLGLFTASSYSESVTRIPVLRRKVKAVMEASGFAPMSHDGKSLMQILETYPRDELFQISVEELVRIALGIQHLQERRQVRLFLRRDVYGRFVSALVYLPRDRYTTKVRLEMERIIRETFGATSVDYAAHASESVLARLHYVARRDDGVSLTDIDVDVPTLEARLAQATRSWQDDFGDAVIEQLGEESGTRLLRQYANAFPEAYKEDFSARSGVADLKRLESLDPVSDLDLNLYEPADAEPGEKRFKVYRSGGDISLSEILPILQRMGVEVTDERPYEIERADGVLLWLYDFGLRRPQYGRADIPVTEVKGLFQQAFSAAWYGRTESDGFNALVMLAGLTWRQVSVIRAYTKYLRQAGSTFSQEYMEQTLTSNTAIAQKLVRLFEVRFDPANSDGRDAAQEDLRNQILADLDRVTSLDQDRILRSLLTLITATLRTSYYQPGRDGQPHPYVSFKLDPQQIPELPLPRPRFEIWVYSPQVEGVHLRFGSVARGGLRWSDRREDFRTEVLGLVKAQAVKNAVIVPVGAKGGFLPKQLPDPSISRDAWLAEGVSAYRTFISALLDITDNRVDGTIVPPSDVVRHDGDDPYLVVAADKGTATFSDIANGIAKDYGFWLGDAFASGGSAGYDHKAMGITARGAWESVKRHFRELDLDTQTQDFTVVGIGDMSGDVFGNGMLLSEHIRLVAAFDHRHIFLDPDPDAASSFTERKRLFELPRSSWADYEGSLISQGGGVFPRSAKSIELTPQVRESLGLDAGVARLTPQELMKAILKAPVDLFWNGGIGTYVKSSQESQSAAGDKANDAIRIDGADLRVRVVGEGGNLGLTQLGRVEAAQTGVRLNTDAIDNSAGVDTSDHEVNIKILLDAVVRSGDLTEKQRNALLSEMTDDVAHHVLRDNYEQNILLGNARAQVHSMLPVHKRFIRQLEDLGELDRALEFLPSDAEIDRRDAAGLGLTSPEFSVLVAYSKMTLADELLATSLPEESYARMLLRSYFPTDVVERFDAILEDHPLRREIITTVGVNDIINRGGITFVYRAQEETGATPAEIARAYAVCREVFDLPSYWRRVEALDNQVPTTAQSALYLEARRLLDRSVRWLLQNRHSVVDIEAEIAHFAQIRDLSPKMPEMLRGSECERLQRRAAEYEATGIPADIALDTAAHLDAFGLLDVVELATASGQDAEAVARLYFLLSDRFDVDKLLTRITMLPRDERWHALARMALRYDLYAALAGLTANVLVATPAHLAPEMRIEQWEATAAEGLARARSTLHEIAASETFDLATISVALRVIRTLVAAGSGTRA